jgi:excisionase family DNA binding protein
MLLTVREASEELKCSERTIRSMVNTGLLEFIKIGVGTRKTIRVKLPEATTTEKIIKRKEYVGKVLARKS